MEALKLSHPLLPSFFRVSCFPSYLSGLVFLGESQVGSHRGDANPLTPENQCSEPLISLTTFFV